jgi:hypothetical protein
MVEECKSYNLVPYSTASLVLNPHNSGKCTNPPKITAKLPELCPFHPTILPTVTVLGNKREAKDYSQNVPVTWERIPPVGKGLLVAVGLRSARAFHRLLMSLVGCVMFASRGVEQMVLVASLVY